MGRMGGVLRGYLGPGLASLVALAMVSVLVGCGGGAKQVDPYAKQIKPNTTKPRNVGIDPDELPEGADDATTVIRPLGKNHFELSITNVSNIGFINSFIWQAPPQMTITAVTGSSSGHCQLSGKDIACESLKVRPPKSTNLSGGTVTVRFAATTAKGKRSETYGVQGSQLRLGELTPVPYKIPSYSGAPPQLDVGLCAKGQQSSRTHPCVQPP
jgi:hypothetical protein